MTPDAYNRSLSSSMPPAELTAPLAALWWAKKGDWDKAHRIVMDEGGAQAAWVHAHLHRVEGDLGNARYWYARAGKQVATGEFDAEWTAIAQALLSA